MNCVVFVYMDKKFQLGKKTKTLKNTAEVKEFCQSGKVGTMNELYWNTTQCLHKYLDAGSRNVSNHFTLISALLSDREKLT